MNPYVQYKQGTTYPQRIWQPSTQIYNQSVVEKILYLLSSTDGLYVTFQIINSAEQAISGVDVNGTRVISGDIVTVAQGTTDSAGAVTFWLNPDFSHTFSFFKTGYTLLSEALTPTQSSYTITLGGTSSVSNDTQQGTLITTSPTSDFLNQNTNYNFSYTISSSYWSLDNFTMSLNYDNGTNIGTNTSTSSVGGTVSLNNINTTEASYIYLNITYSANGTLVTPNPRLFIVQNITGQSYSINHLFADFAVYSNSNFLGLDNFGKSLFSALFIFLIVGGIGYRYGLNSQAALMGILFGVVFFLDVALNFIPEISVAGITATNHFLTIITFFILIAMLLREEMR